MIRLVRDPIDLAECVATVTSPVAGAVVLFVGTVRELTAGRRTTALDYDCYPEMAEKQMAVIEAEARTRWPIVECVIVHRLGHMEPAEASVAVALSTPHRRDAFEAAAWVMDTLKAVVPIWKKELWADGSTEWVHPGLPTETPR